MRTRVEICVDSVDGAVVAEKAGADRLELCAGLVEGGTTPSIGTIGTTLDALRRVGVQVLVRPRGGDFLYSAAELTVMLADIEAKRRSSAGTHVRGRHHVERAVDPAGLTCTDVEVHELFTAADRVVVYCTQHLRHHATGGEVTISALKMYRLKDGRIVEFWGETDLYGLLGSSERCRPR